MVGLAGSVMLEAFREAGFAVAAEAFADRRYEADGSLRSRKFADALITDPDGSCGASLADRAARKRAVAWDGAEISDRRADHLHSWRHAGRQQSRTP